MFLFLVIINGWFKYYINTFKGRLGERMLRRIRFDLVDACCASPSPVQAREVRRNRDHGEGRGRAARRLHRRCASSRRLSSAARRSPPCCSSWCRTVWLGLIAAAIVGVQVVLIPRLRRRLLVLGRERQLTARQLAGRVAEMVEGVTDDPRQRHVELRARRDLRAGWRGSSASASSSTSGSSWSSSSTTSSPRSRRSSSTRWAAIS